MMLRMPHNEIGSILGWIGAALNTAFAIPQLVKALRARSVAGVSIPTYLLFAGSSMVWLAYAIIERQGPVAGSSVGGILISFGIVVTVYLRETEEKRRATTP